MRYMAMLCVLTGFLPWAAMAATPAPAPVPGCTSAESKQFDFWVGDWNVFSKGSDQQAAKSHIENLYKDCAVREHWMPLTGAKGGSLNSYDALTKKWKQLWVSENGSVALFAGGWNGNAMVLEGIWGNAKNPTQLTRMTYTRLADGSVEQLGVTSDDHGKTWQPSFDLIYRRAK